ncbi:MAG: hypothetical protein ACK5CE_04085 [Actinomycetes bacterium]
MPRVEWTRFSGEDIEMVIAIMLLRERPRAAHMRPSSGDGGIDVITPQPCAPPIVDQIKSFASGALTAGRKKQIGSSLDSVRIELSDQIGEWNLVLPMNHTREQRRWFEALDAPFETNWRGLTYLEGLVAKYPDVVDYYLNGGRERVVQHATDLLRLSSLQLDVTNGGGLDVAAVTTALVAACDTINRSEPHYRYEFRVGTGATGAPPNQEGWMFSQTVGPTGGTPMAIDIFARFQQASELRPIPMSVTLRPQTHDDDAAVQEFFDYGTDIEIPADVQLPEGVPGGLPNPSGPARIRIMQHQPTDRPDIELRIIDVGNDTVSTLPVRITSSSQGRAGGRFQATDNSGAVQVEGRTSEKERRATFNYSVQLDRLEGQPVRACLNVVRFSTSLCEPNRLALAFRHGGVFATSQPIIGGVFADEQRALMSLLEDLSILQDRCPVPLCWNSREAAEDQRDIHECASMLRGETIEGTWNHFHAEMLAGGRPLIDAITEPGALLYERELGFQAFGQEFSLGIERLMFETVVPNIEATAADGSFGVTFTPGVSNRYVRSLVRT